MDLLPQVPVQFPPQMQDYYDPNQHQSPQDVNAARAQLQQLPEGRDLLSGARSVILAFNTRKNLDREVATNIATQLGQSPLAIQVIPFSAFGYADLVDTVRDPQHNVDLFIYSWHVRGPYPERILVPLFHSDWKASNLTGYGGADRQLDDVLKNSPNNSQVATAVQKIIQDAPMVFVGHVMRRAAWRKQRVNLGPFTSHTWLNTWDGLPCDKLALVDVA